MRAGHRGKGDALFGHASGLGLLGLFGTLGGSVLGRTLGRLLARLAFGLGGRLLGSLGSFGRSVLGGTFGRLRRRLGFGGSFAPDLTGAQNVRFVARIYGVDTDALVDYVQGFAELGDFLDMPVRAYSSGMRARLAFGACLALDFDVYLIDEVTEIGDERFRRKCAAAFRERMRSST